MTDGLGHLGQKKAKMNEVRTGQKNKKRLSGGSKKCPFYAPAVLLINKNKEERMRYDYENDENQQKRNSYGDRD